MPSLARGESSSAANPVLDMFTAVGNPPVATDVSLLEFAILDISTPAKKGVPVQVFPDTGPGTFFPLDPANAAPGPGPDPGVRLGVGAYFAPYTVPLDAAIGDHKIVWQFQENALSPLETLSEEFFVTEGALLGPTLYCGVTDLRNEGYTDPPFTDARINALIPLASRYVDKMTGRWFGVRPFADPDFFLVDGKGGRVLHLEIPIIRIDSLSIQAQGLFNPDITLITADNYRVYNRHIKGNTLRDDREDPRIAMIPRRVVETVASGLLPAPFFFPEGRQNIFLEGLFGYTDFDGSATGKVPDLIRQVTCRLVARDLLLDSDSCAKLNVKNKFMIRSDKEGDTTIKLQNIWLKGAFTGDAEIDNILIAYKRPAHIGIA